MKLIVNIKPTTTKASTLSELKDKINCFGFIMNKYFNGYPSSFNDDNYVYAFVFEKHRRKAKHTKKKRNGALTTISEPIKNNHWIGYKYKFPIELLKTLNVRLVQKNRHFVLEKIK